MENYQSYDERKIAYFRERQAAHERELKRLKRLQRQMPQGRAELMQQYAACVNECEIAQYYEDAVRTAPLRWIRTDERLPESPEEGVLVIVSGRPRNNVIFEGAVMIAFYYNDEGWLIEDWEDWENPHVSHWMPLPEPPEEEKHGKYTTL